MNVLTQEVWVKSAITPACESAPHCFLSVIPLTLSPCPPGWDYLWWVNELNVALAYMISPWSVWIKWTIFRPSDAHISEFRLNPPRQVFSDPELNLACKWICLCWINSDGNLPTLDGRAFYQCVLPQGFRLYKIQLDTLKKMHSHGGIRVEVREPWLNLLKSFFSSAVFSPCFLVVIVLFFQVPVISVTCLGPLCYVCFVSLCSDAVTLAASHFAVLQWSQTEISVFHGWQQQKSPHVALSSKTWQHAAAAILLRNSAQLQLKLRK